MTEVNMKPPAWGSRDSAVCYQGAISWERGLREMVAAVAQADRRLLLAGAYSDEMDRTAVRQLPGWEAVEELGTLDRSRLWAIMCRCRIGLVLFHPCPNHMEAQPNKLFEYMAAGLPVIASNFPMWRELVEGCRCGICVDPMDSKAIAKGITWLFDHPEEADKMGQRGREAIREHFNWESEARKLLALYDSLA
jgi:glycosyltransferase involved in cell wall biosynthesis